MTTVKYLEACDASAATAISGTALFVAASDEDCVLRVYDRKNPGRPLTSTDVADFLEPDDPEEREADIEGAARLGDRVFWIGSHGRSKKGKERKIRQRIFATALQGADRTMRLVPSGVPFKNLLSALGSAPTLTPFDLSAAAALKPEEEGGLNIEGLAATPEGHLFVGFRNPVRNGRALIVRLRNAPALVDGQAERAHVELAAVLDLSGRSIRALEFIPSLGIYLVLAGAFNDAGDFRLYRWSGEAEAPAIPLNIDALGMLNPEELIVVEGSGEALDLHVLSDDGTDACKATAPALRSFRALTVPLVL